MGGFWYASNLVDHGNPLYPVRVELLGREILHGKFTVRDVAKSLPARDPGNRRELVRVVRSWAHDVAPWTHPGAEFCSEEQRVGGLDYVFLRNDGQAYRWARADPAHFRLLSAGRLFSAVAVDEP